MVGYSVKELIKNEATARRYVKKVRDLGYLSNSTGVEYLEEALKYLTVCEALQFILMTFENLATDPEVGEKYKTKIENIKKIWPKLSEEETYATLDSSTKTYDVSFRAIIIENVKFSKDDLIVIIKSFIDSIEGPIKWYHLKEIMNWVIISYSYTPEERRLTIQDIHELTKESYQSLFNIICSHNLIELFDQCFEKGVELDPVASGNLYMAVSKGHHDILEKMIKNGVDLQKEGKCLFIAATRNSDVETIQILLENPSINQIPFDSEIAQRIMDMAQKNVDGFIYRTKKELEEANLPVGKIEEVDNHYFRCLNFWGNFYASQ